MSKRVHQNDLTEMQQQQEEPESVYQLKLEESLSQEQKEVLEQKYVKRKLSKSISYSEKTNNLESVTFNFAFHQDKLDNQDRELSVSAEYGNSNREAFGSIFRKNSEMLLRGSHREVLTKAHFPHFPFLKEKTTEESSNAEHSKHKYEIVYNKNESFKSKFTIDFKPLSPFLWALEFVKRIKQQESKVLFMPESNPPKRPQLSKRSYRDSELQEVFTQEMKKCHKLSRKLRIAWKLDQKIPQNVFKKLLKQSTKSLSEAVSYNESFVSPEQKGTYRTINHCNLENNPHLSNVGGSRNLRITTQLKKQQNIILNQKKKLCRQSQNCKKSKEYDLYELLDYANKNIRKDPKFKEQSSDESRQE
jgi:hypothetical protein